MISTPERAVLCAAIYKLHSEGFSRSTIALQLGMTKNVVVGIIRRRPIDASPPLVTVRWPAPNHCLWIVGDAAGPDTVFCNQPTSRIGSSWCPEHRKIVYLGAWKAKV